MSRRSSARWGDELHRRYRARPGASFIASGYALGLVHHVALQRRPRSVLEVGAGIGALTECLVDARARAGGGGTQVAVEDEPFCLAQLEANLGDRFCAVVVVDRAAAVPPGVGEFDLVVVDGGAVSDLAPEHRHRWSADQERAEVAAWMDRLATGALVVVENRRDRQRAHIEAEARLRGRSVAHQHRRPFDGTPGAHLYWFEPTVARRALVAVTEAVRRRWGVGAARAWRRLHRRFGWTYVARDTVAPGADAEPGPG